MAKVRTHNARRDRRAGLDSLALISAPSAVCNAKAIQRPSKTQQMAFCVTRCVHDSIGCGAEANASCNCGVSYVAKSVRAAEAIRANPNKSDRAIAAELGVGNKTVSRARNSLVSDDTGEDERVGRDGKSYSIRQRVTQKERAARH